MDIHTLIEQLLYYSTKKLSLDEFDVIYVRNNIYKILNIECPKEVTFDKSQIDELIVPDMFVDGIRQYIEENHYEICGPIRESYIDGVWNKDSADEWLSEIQIPVRKRV